MRRIPRYVLPAGPWLLPPVSADTVVLMDIENTLISFVAPGATAPALDPQLRFLNRVVDRLIVVSNRRVPLPEHLCVPTVWRARKPFTRRARLALAGERRVLVVGDLPITDGLLAWRLGVPFLQVALTETGEPPWPRFLRRFGGAFTGAFFNDLASADELVQALDVVSRSAGPWLQKGPM